MSWKFWAKKAPDASKKPKLPGPKELPDAVGRQLVVDMGLDPDWVWSLKAVIRDREGERYVRDFRVFDPVKAVGAGIGVKNYDALDAHADQILFAGWYNTDTGEVHLSPGASDKAA
jgi:hypothetical protein